MSDLPQRLEDFPADARWIQTQRGAVIACKDGRVFRRKDGATVELVELPAIPAPDRSLCEACAPFGQCAGVCG